MILSIAFSLAIIAGILSSLAEMHSIHSGAKPGVRESDNMLDFLLNGDKTK